jgi:hypothetical protein
MCDCVEEYSCKNIYCKNIYCKNPYCENKICTSCAIECNCCDNSICTECAALCEIEGCTAYICIPKIKKYDSSNNIYYEYDREANPCWTGCGRNHICLDHRCYLYDEDLVICINCEEGSEYICKCGDCFDHKIYKNCEIKCQVRKECTNYIKSNHMLTNNCETCNVGDEVKYSCIDCFIIIDDKKYCVNCAKA